MYDELVAALIATGIPFAEYEWKTRPDSDFGIVALEMDAARDDGDDVHVNVAKEGSVDLFLRSGDKTLIEAVRTAIESVCGASFYENSRTYEQANRILHVEWVFQLECE